MRVSERLAHTPVAGLPKGCWPSPAWAVQSPEPIRANERLIAQDFCQVSDLMTAWRRPVRLGGSPSEVNYREHLTND